MKRKKKDVTIFRVYLFTSLPVYYLLKQKPRRGTFAFVEAVCAGEQSQALGWDHVNFGVIKPGTGEKRVWFEESVHEPESAWGEDSIQLIQIIHFVLNAVKAAEVKCKVKFALNLFHLGGIVGEDIGLNAGFF